MRFSRPGIWTACAAGMALAATGCGRPNPVAPTIMELPDARGAASAALSTYDRDGDGALSMAELEACPGLLSAAAQIDADGNGSVSAEELEGRIARIVDRDLRYYSLACQLEVDGRPLPNAELAFEPEAFFAPMNRPAHASLGPDGRSYVQTEGETTSGIYPGYYRVRVSRKDASGKELLPAKLNS